MALAAGRGTSWGPLADVIIAQRINRVCGGSIIAPWEVCQLDNTWIDIMTGLSQDLPAIKHSYDAIEGIKDRIRRNHPSFSKRIQRTH